MAAPLIGLAARKAIKKAAKELKKEGLKSSKFSQKGPSPARKAAKEVGETLGGIGLGTAGLYGASEIIGKDMEKKARKKLMKEGGSAARKFKERYGK